MRILQVVTLISPDGAYGGPVRVAVNQARALIAEGHDVTIAAGHSGFGGAAPASFDGVPVRLFPVTSIVPGAGFAGLYSPAMLRWLKSSMSTVDVVHIHLARDLVTLPAARMALKNRKPMVIQSHGMIDASQNPLSKPLDFLLTGPVLRGASSVFYLTDKEKADLNSLGFGHLALEHLQNGVPVPSGRPTTTTSEVLYLARLHKRKRPMMFVEMAQALAGRFPSTRFVLVGPDEGEGPDVERAIASPTKHANLSWEGALSPELTTDRVAQCSIFVLPSVHEPFPMSVLEAMALGKPVVVTDTCGLAEVILETGSGRVVDSRLVSLVGAVESLLADNVGRRLCGENARVCASDYFSMTSVVSKLADAYRRAVRHKGRP